MGSLASPLENKFASISNEAKTARSHETMKGFFLAIAHLYRPDSVENFQVFLSLISRIQAVTLHRLSDFVKF